MGKQDDNIVGNNIRSLRNAYKETQEKLANILHVSRSAISQYENGDRQLKSNPDLCEAIAKHYQITVYELLYLDFSDFSFPIEKFRAGNSSFALTRVLFPIITSQKAEDNKNFKRGYDAHLKLVDTLEKGRGFDGNKADECERNYEKAMNNVTEAGVNLTGILVLSEVVLKNSQLLCDLNNKGKSDSSLMERIKDLDKMDIASFENLTISYIKTLAQSWQYRELAYFYTAVRYLMKCVQNKYSDEFNSAIGAEMMKSLFYLNNKYANDYFKALHDLQ